MKRLWFYLLLLIYTNVGSSEDLPLKDLYGSMDRTVLEAEVARSTTPGAPDAETMRLKRLGIAWHNLASIDNGWWRAASEQAFTVLTQAQTANPNDPEVLAYLGSAQTLIARDSWNVFTKISQVNKGIALIDKAVSLAPSDVAVRMIRAHNSLKLPESFGRQPRALEDLEFLYAHKSTLNMKVETQAEICFMLGEIMIKNGDAAKAKTLFTEARTLAPQSQWAQRAAEKL